MVGDVVGDDGSGAYQGALADGHATHDDGPAADRCATLDDGWNQGPVAFRLRTSVFGRSGVAVVDEHNPVAHEHLVLDADALANEGVGGDLAAGADADALL